MVSYKFISIDVCKFISFTSMYDLCKEIYSFDCFLLSCLSCFCKNSFQNYFGRTIAVDASMCLYQFLIAVRSEGSYQLTDEKGETTSHIIGMFYRTIRMLDNGLKPVYVFDGMLV